MSWDERELTLAPRKWRRTFSEAVAGSITKSLTEPIINSWDSYKALGVLPPDSGLVSKLLALGIGERVQHELLVSGTRDRWNAPIRVQVSTTRGSALKKRQCSILDQASGMDKGELMAAMEEYGAAKSGQYQGRPVRGLFGQGISDVLFGHHDGTIVSVKDRVRSEAQAKWGPNGKPYAWTRTVGRISKTDRKALSIRKNGTRVDFVLDGRKCHIPDPQPLYRKLCNFYMLRLINCDPACCVVLEQHRASGKVKRDELNYRFPAGIVIGRFDAQVRIEGYAPILLECIVCRSDEPLRSGGSLEDREGGLLVVDEHDTVYDLTLFEFENQPGLESLFGVVRLTGFRELARDRIDNHRESLITDGRDGFDRRKVFWAKLCAALSSELKPIVESEKRRVLRAESELTEDVKIKVTKAFQELNSLFREQTEETGEVPDVKLAKWPETVEGIQFWPKDSAVLRVGIPRRLHLLVGRKAVRPDAQVLIESRNADVVVEPGEGLVRAGRQVSAGVVALPLTVSSSVAGSSGTVEALVEAEKGEDLTAVLTVNDVRWPPELLPPESGIEFRPAFASAEPHMKGSAYLFADARVVPLGTEIEFKVQAGAGSIAMLTRSEIESDTTKHALAASDMVPDAQIARVPVYFRGHGKGEQGTITAKAKVEGQGSLRSSVTVRIRETEPGGSGIFRRPEYIPLVDRKVAADFDISDGVVYVNARHPLNKALFGLTKESFNEAVAKEERAQVRLAEVLMEQAMYHILATKYQAGGAKGWSLNEHDPIGSVRTTIEEWKYDRGAPVFRALVTNFRVPRDSPDV